MGDDDLVVNLSDMDSRDQIELDSEISSNVVTPVTTPLPTVEEKQQEHIDDLLRFHFFQTWSKKYQRNRKNKKRLSNWSLSSARSRLVYLLFYLFTSLLFLVSFLLLLLLLLIKFFEVTYYYYYYYYMIVMFI